jgi:hypothetical protein
MSTQGPSPPAAANLKIHSTPHPRSENRSENTRHALPPPVSRRSHTRQQAKVVYPLDEVLLLALLATLAGAETFTDIARFGEKKLALLRRFRPFKDGTPPHDRIGDIFATLDAEQFQRCFVAWVASVTGIPEGVIAIDGKTVRRSGRKKEAPPQSACTCGFGVPTRRSH